MDTFRRLTTTTNRSLQAFRNNWLWCGVNWLCYALQASDDDRTEDQTPMKSSAGFPESVESNPSPTHSAMTSYATMTMGCIVYIFAPHVRCDCVCSVLSSVHNYKRIYSSRTARTLELFVQLFVYSSRASLPRVWESREAVRPP